ncbi:MAG: GNAT family N-acetyltransferase [Verrucomicrobiaceae bacterium]|nr:MAG: GNAT family N-acetyltransferase [Verrucomicrobiaceae bacterium]
MNPCQLHLSERPGEERSDARIHLTDASGATVAAAALWWTDTPALDGNPIGTIGNFEARDATAAKSLLDHAAGILRERGCHTAIGPMNGNTWRRHRFVVWSNGRGSFLLEPRNPPEHPGWWAKAGFSILSRYSSSVMPLDGSEVLPPAVKARLAKSGVTVRNLDASRYEDELRLIHAISLKSFSSNFLYTPLEEDAFLHAYLKVQTHVDPDLVRIAERDGKPCGFVFGIPDLEAAGRGEQPALIVKTLAVDPESHCAGLGSLLVDELHRIGREKGYTEAIHALQHESNTSLKITGRHHGEVLRRYALFSRPL